MIPSFDGMDFRQYERRVRLFVSHTRVAPQRRAGKLLDVHSTCVKESRTWKHRRVLRILLHHMRMYFEPIDVFRQGRVVIHASWRRATLAQSCFLP